MGDKYVVRARNKTRFELVLKDVGDGLSFRQVAKTIQNAREARKCAAIGGITGQLVASYVRILVGVNLQIIGDVLNQRRKWAYAFAGAGSTCHGVYFSDIRLRLMVGRNLTKAHLLLVPFYERHTTENSHSLVCTILSSLRPAWRDSLLAVISDGENNMTGNHGGLLLFLRRKLQVRFFDSGADPIGLI